MAAIFWQDVFSLETRDLEISLQAVCRIPFSEITHTPLKCQMVGFQAAYLSRIPLQYQQEPIFNSPQFVANDSKINWLHFF